MIYLLFTIFLRAFYVPGVPFYEPDRAFYEPDTKISSFLLSGIPDMIPEKKLLLDKVHYSPNSNLFSTAMM